MNDDWKFIHGSEAHDRWVRISPDGRYLMISEWESSNGGVKKTIRIEKIELMQGMPMPEMKP